MAEPATSIHCSIRSATRRTRKFLNNQRFDAIGALPFVRETTAAERRAGRPPRILWAVRPSGNYEVDCQTGASYAQMALDFTVSDASSNLLRSVLTDMVRYRGKDLTGIEIGFLSVVAECATNAA